MQTQYNATVSCFLVNSFAWSVGLPLPSDSPLCRQMLAPMLTSFTYTADNPERQLEHVISLTRLTVLKLSGSLQNPLDATMCTHWLCQLPSLHTLHLSHPSHITSDTFRMQQLRCLHLQSPLDPLCDLSRCTQLTSLYLELVENNNDVLECLTLPVGDDVRLKHLRLERGNGSNGQFLKGFQTMENLAAATRLTKLEIRHCFPNSLVQKAWPPCLPMLKVLKLTGLKYDFPPQLLQYKCLQEVSFALQHGIRRIPVWFSQMTQLQRVAFPSSSFSEFATPLLELTQLKSLSLSTSCRGVLTTLPRAILSVAAWPHLSCLDLCSPWGRQGLSLDSHLVLLQLMEALGTRQSILRI